MLTLRVQRLPFVLLLCAVLLASGCTSSKYGDPITRVNYYPRCYAPIQQLREDENSVGKSTATGAMAGAVFGAIVGALSTGRVQGAAAGAITGSAAGAVGGNIYGKQQARSRDAALLARYTRQLEQDTAAMNRTVAAAQVAKKCYNEEFNRIVAEYKAGYITKKDCDEYYAEIRSGLQEVSYILQNTYDSMAKKDEEYARALADDFTEAPEKKSASASATKTVRSRASNRKAAMKTTRDEWQEIDKTIVAYDSVMAGSENDEFARRNDDA